MNAVYIRMAFYVLAPLAAMLTGVTFDLDAGTLLIDLEAAALGLAAALGGVAAVFRKWGKK